MIRSCGCVEFFMIRNSTTRICSASEKECYVRAKDDFVSLEQTNCFCLERCNYLKHNLEIKAVSLKEYVKVIIKFYINLEKQSEILKSFSVIQLINNCYI